MTRQLFPELLRDKAFRRFWAGQSVSLVGDQVSLLAIPLTGVLVLHASAIQMGYLVAAQLLPSLLLSLLAGAWLDHRGHRRRHMLAADLGRAAALLGIPIAAWLHALTLLQLYATALVLGSFDVLFFVAYSSLFVSLVRPNQYVAANSLLNGSRAASQVGGQSAAGALVAVLSAPVALIADAASFLVSAAFLSLINPCEAPTSERGVRGVVDGVRFIASSVVVRRMLMASATLNYFNYVFTAMFVLFAVRQLGVGPAALGVVLGIGSIGTVLGSLSVGSLIRRLAVGRTLLAGGIAFPAPLLLVPAAPGHSPWAYAILATAEFASGFGLMLYDISAATIQATVVPSALRSRVSGAYRTVNYGVRPLGALCGGLAGAAIGLRATLWIGGIGAVLSALWLTGSQLARLGRDGVVGAEAP